MIMPIIIIRVVTICMHIFTAYARFFKLHMQQIYAFVLNAYAFKKMQMYSKNANVFNKKMHMHLR